MLTSCERLFLSEPRARSPILTLILSVLLARPYDPGTPYSETMMSAMATHSIFNAIIFSALFDTSNYLFPLCLRVLLALIPYAPLTLTPSIPLIMVILGRAISWRDRAFIDSSVASTAAVTHTAMPKPSWDVADSSSQDTIELPLSLQPHRVVRLTLVATYGGWPSNVLAFIRDPVLYLEGKHISSLYQVDWREIYPVGQLARRAGPLLRDFGLHPSLVQYTSAAELADVKRWDKHDPSEYVARSHGIAHLEPDTSEKFDFWHQAESTSKTMQDVPVTVPAIIYANGTVEQLQREVTLLKLESAYSDRVRKQYLYRSSSSTSSS